MIYEIQATLSITYTVTLLVLSIVTIFSSITLLYQTILSNQDLSDISFYITSIIFIHTIVSFFSAILTLVSFLHAFIRTCIRQAQDRRQDIFTI